MNGCHDEVSRARARKNAALLLCAALGLGAGLGCSSDDQKQEQRRELLQPRDLKRDLDAERRRRQLYDEKGELLPSDETVAGIVLPKGLRLQQKIGNRWFYQTKRIPADKLERYFSRRLMRNRVERGEGSVAFVDAVPASDPKAPRLRVQIEALRGSATASQIYIEQAVPFKPKIPYDQVEAQLRAARERAD